ncbi:hypothetical protein LTR62_004865 [Meristemomyces frigidus]|uniref:Peroxisome membrane anchor protein Pex14p N-terminal domain-containing protein n=1 Tax=Meristemomyces frigidus TaxID=1508187 RepID=A0AAN7TQ99_9PEZI|nr:hypothetical protein LTR62_004865 [Meristemomyces frigidus]
MGDDSSKSAVPSWQQKRREQESDVVSSTVDVQAKDTALPSGQAAGISDAADSEDSSPPEHSDAQLEMVEAFLADPKVKDESAIKKRAFLESKNIPVETIDQVMTPEKGSRSKTFDTTSFTAFRKQRPQPSTSAVPIITYPEYLVSAHKPAPLVTPARVIYATYFAAGLTTLFYAAGNFLVKPMTDSLTEARHDFATHSASKLEEFNERLSGIVSKVPDTPSPHGALEIEAGDAESVTSDPTELYHRDMGTQTEPPPPKHSSDPFIPDITGADPVASHATRLDTITSHLNSLTQGLETYKASHSERKESMSKLRHSLDLMIYGSSMSSQWEDPIDEPGKISSKKAEFEAFDLLKKEIRGVKGVLLSARRFPGAGVGMGRAGT